MTGKTDKKTDTVAENVVKTDRFDVVGDEYRAGLDEYKPFRFDADADRLVVEHIAVASNASEFVLEVDGKYLTFDPQLAAALRRLVTAGTINLNL